MQELAPYFKAYESRDNTIGQGNLSVLMQVSYCRVTTLMCIDSIPHLSTGAVAMPKTVKASA